MSLVATVLAATQLCCVPPATAPPPISLQGDTEIHDPALVVRSSPPRWVAYGTHGTALVADGRGGFAPGGESIAPQAWWQPFGDATKDRPPWAPDVSFHDGTWWMYYSVSRKGSGHSAIGLATSPTGLPGSWSDRGPVLASDGSQPYNAIDPNLLVAADGTWWLVFGSFWHGIYMAALDPSTGKVPAGALQLHHLAERPPVPPAGYDPHAGAIEGPFVLRRGDAYYLFVSFDHCCNGVGSTYNIRVGRSAAPTGPYVDKAGVGMLQGGGSPVLRSRGDAIGPGGQSVVHDPVGDRDLLVYHYYDARNGGRPTLGVNPLGWTFAGWPFVRRVG